jgi:hypothetical protein
VLFVEKLEKFTGKKRYRKREKECLRIEKKEEGKGKKIVELLEFPSLSSLTFNS